RNGNRDALGRPGPFGATVEGDVVGSDVDLAPSQRERLQQRAGEVVEHPLEGLPRQEFRREVVEEPRLPFPASGPVPSLERPSKEAADDRGHDEEHDEGDQLLRFAPPERVLGRREEEVQAEEREDRRRQTGPQPSDGRRRDDRQDVDGDRTGVPPMERRREKGRRGRCAGRRDRPANPGTSERPHHPLHGPTLAAFTGSSCSAARPSRVAYASRTNLLSGRSAMATKEAGTEARPSVAPARPARRSALPQGPGYGVKRAILGPALPTAHLVHERLGKPTALAVFASDNLSSVAYATEAILKVGVPIAGLAAFSMVMPITFGILG